MMLSRGYHGIVGKLLSLFMTVPLFTFIRDYIHMALFRVRGGKISAQVSAIPDEPSGESGMPRRVLRFSISHEKQLL
jgi:hypothetical protein